MFWFLVETMVVLEKLINKNNKRDIYQLDCYFITKYYLLLN